MLNINELPKSVQEEVKETLKAFTKANVWFSDGEYHVSSGVMIKNHYSEDDRFIGTWTPDDIFTEEERMINYIESFHDYPIAYKGKRDYRMLDSIGNNWKVKFKMVDGNLVVA